MNYANLVGKRVELVVRLVSEGSGSPAYSSKGKSLLPKDFFIFKDEQGNFLEWYTYTDRLSFPAIFERDKQYKIVATIKKHYNDSLTETPKFVTEIERVRILGETTIN